MNKVMNNSLSDLVKALPEVYQPIFGHPEFSNSVSRECENRLTAIVQVYKALEKQLSRPLSVLDLGCAQGFFSFSLAKLGAKVHGIDYLGANIAVCQILMHRNPEFKVSFETRRIEDFLSKLTLGKYDLVLGLSVFHHIIHEKGIGVVQKILAELSDKVTVGVLELALKTEPLYWGEAQPQDPRQLLESFAFVHEIERYNTHLSDIPRPMYAVSNYCWLLDDQTGKFDEWQADSHIFAKGTHQGSRRYFFGNGLCVKIFRIDLAERAEINLNEYSNEVRFLLDPPPGFAAPRMSLQGQNKQEVWLVREHLPGELLVDIISAGKPYETEYVLQEVLAQLVALESSGLYHNDLRAWNVLICPDGEVRLIDYGAISGKEEDCIWPKNVFLAFFIFAHEIYTKQIESPVTPRAISFSSAKIELLYHNWVLAFFATPSDQWSFKLMQRLFLLFKRVEKDGNVTIDCIEKKLMQTEVCASEFTSIIKYNSQLESQVRKLRRELNTIRAKMPESETDAQKIESLAQCRYNNFLLFILRISWFFRKSSKPKSSDIIAAYYFFLKRAPESEVVISQYLQEGSIQGLLNSFKNSQEFTNRIARIELSQPAGSSSGSFFKKMKNFFFIIAVWVYSKRFIRNRIKKGICTFPWFKKGIETIFHRQIAKLREEIEEKIEQDIYVNTDCLSSFSLVILDKLKQKLAT